MTQKSAKVHCEFSYFSLKWGLCMDGLSELGDFSVRVVVFFSWEESTKMVWNHGALCCIWAVRPQGSKLG